MKSGYLVRYTNKEGEEKRGKVLYSDQTPEIEKQGKCLVRLIDDRFQNTGHNVVKRNHELTVFGFID